MPSITRYFRIFLKTVINLAEMLFGVAAAFASAAIEMTVFMSLLDETGQGGKVMAIAIVLALEGTKVFLHVHISSCRRAKTTVSTIYTTSK